MKNQKYDLSLLDSNSYRLDESELNSNDKFTDLYNSKNNEEVDYKMPVLGNQVFISVKKSPFSTFLADNKDLHFQELKKVYFY